MEVEFPVHNVSPHKKASPKIRVVVRKRPLSSKEDEQNCEDIICIDKETNTALLHEPKLRVDMSKYTQIHRFCFDDAYGEDDTNLEIYERSVRPLVETVFQRGMASCFAYGQTGTGKTYTMMGEGSSNPGLYRLAATDIFSTIDSRQNRDLTVRVSFFEIYGGKLFDLLNNRQRLESREDNRGRVNIAGLSVEPCPSIDHLFDVIDAGNSIRQTGSTNANINSSRSHAVLQVDVIHQKSNKLFGQFRFIDLAGSERGSDRGKAIKRKARMEGAEINKSLLALKECIRALDQQHGHVPFRGSKLTQVLKDSFSGNCRTVMIANISPSNRCCEHTLNTLRYADRVKELKKSKKSKRHNAYMPHQNRRPRQVEERAPALGKRNEPARQSKPKKRIKRNASSKNLPRPLTSPNRRKQVPPLRAHLPPSNNLVCKSPDSSPASSSSEAVDPEKEALKRTHEGVVAKIYEMEDQLVKTHRNHIDTLMTLIKKDMHLLKQFDRMVHETDDYVVRLDKIITEKEESLNNLRRTLDKFKENLQQEEIASQNLKA